MDTVTLSKVLDQAAELPADEQEMLIEILQKRRAESWRRELAADVKQAKRELAAGKLKLEPHDAMKRRLRRSLKLGDD